MGESREDRLNRIRQTAQAGGVQRRQSGPVAQGEWFTDSTVRTPDKPTAMEEMMLDDIRKDAQKLAEELALSPTAQEKILRDATELVSGLSKNFLQDARRASEIVKRAADQLKGVDGAEKQRLVNEVMSALTARTPLSDLQGNNVLAQEIIASGALEDINQRASITTQAKGERVRTPNLSYGRVLGIGAFAWAVTTLGLEIGTTKTAVIQLLDIFYTTPGIRHSVDALTNILISSGVSESEAATYAKTAIGMTIAGTIGGTLVGTKSLGLKNLSTKGKIAFWTSFGASLGLGYLALQNYVADTSEKAVMGTVVEERLDPVAKEAERVKKDREKMTADLNTDIAKGVNDEVNRPGATGYAHYSAFVESGLTGTFDQARFDAFLATKSETDRQKILTEHKRLQDILDKLKLQFFSTGGNTFDKTKGLKHLTPSVNLDAAPALSNAVVQVGKTAKETTMWSGLLKVLKPWGGVATPSGMYEQARKASEAFTKLVVDDKTAIDKSRTDIGKYLDGMIAAVPTIREYQPLRNTLTTLKATLLKRLEPIKVAPDFAEKAFNQITPPSGRWVIIPDDKVWAQMQATIKDAFIFKQLGWDVMAEGKTGTFWAFGLVVLLAGFFAFINGSSYLLSKWQNSRREGEFEGAVQEGTEDLNARESALAIGVGTAAESAIKQFVLNSGQQPFKYPVPRSLIELHVRGQLRELYIRERMTTDEWKGWVREKKERLGWFRHGLVFGKTPEDARALVDYNKWLEAKMKALDTQPVIEMEKLMSEIFPEFTEVIVANNKVLTAPPAAKAGAQRQLTSEMLRMRSVQLKKYATLIEERLAVIDISATPNAAPEAARDGEIRINPDDENIIVSRNLAIAAFAARNTIGERDWLEGTLRNLRQMGIEADRTVSDKAELVIGKFTLGPKHAMRDQLTRIRAAKDTGGIITPEGKAENYERFDKYMSLVARALKGVRDDVISKDPELKDLFVDFVWRKTEGGYYTIDIDLYRDKNLLGKRVANLTYNRPIPDFDPKKTPEEAIRGLVDFLKPGSPAINGLIAQERNSFYKEQHTKLLEDIRRARGTGQQPPEVTIIDGGKKTPPNDELRAKLIDAYHFSELLAEQEPSLILARRGIQIEADKFRAFLDPKKYTSDMRSGVALERYLSDLLLRNFDDDISVVYNAGTKRFMVTKIESGFLGRRQAGAIETIEAHNYRQETLEAAIRKVREAQ